VSNQDAKIKEDSKSFPTHNFTTRVSTSTQWQSQWCSSNLCDPFLYCWWSLKWVLKQSQA